MQKIFLLVAFSLLFTTMYCQNDIEKEILQQEDSKLYIIVKGKELLTDKIIRGDIAKVKEIKEYLLSDKFDEFFPIFSQEEYYLLLYYTREFEELANSIVNPYSNINRNTYGNPYYLYHDWHYNNTRDIKNLLKHKNTENRISIQNDILNSKLPSDSKSFLILLFNYIVTSHITNTSQAEFNDMADEFLTQYPESPFNSFILRNIRYKYSKKDWGYAWSAGLNCGLLTGYLKDTYKTFGGINLSFEVRYRKLMLNLDAGIGFSATKRDLDYSLGIINKGKNVNVSLLSSNLGYIFDYDKFKIIPSIGIMGLDFPHGGTDYPNEYNEVDLKMSLAYSFGVFFDIRIGQNRNFFPSVWTYYVRLGYFYNLATFEKKYPGVTGNLHLLKVMLIWDIQKYKRI